MAWRFSTDRADRALDVREAFLRVLHDGNDRVDTFIAHLIFTELVANVIRHTPGPIDIALDAAGDSLWLHVGDRGPPFELNPVIPAPHAERGRGLYLISQYAADLSVERTSEGNVVHVRLNPSVARDAAMEQRQPV